MRCSLVVFALLSACSPRPDAAASKRALLEGIQFGAAIEDQRVRSFQFALKDPWAVAFDPASPAGCVLGGSLTEAPAKGAPPRCHAYVLQRRKNRWHLLDSGAPGALELPEKWPADLGSGELSAFTL